jgi:hypothetical protein
MTAQDSAWRDAVIILATLRLANVRSQLSNIRS